MSTVHGEKKGKEKEKNGSAWNFFLLKTKGDFFLLSKSRRLYDS